METRTKLSEIEDDQNLIHNVTSSITTTVCASDA